MIYFVESGNIQRFGGDKTELLEVIKFIWKSEIFVTLLFLSNDLYILNYTNSGLHLFFLILFDLMIYFAQMLMCILLRAALYGELSFNAIPRGQHLKIYPNTYNAHSIRWLLIQPIRPILLI